MRDERVSEHTFDGIRAQSHPQWGTLNMHKSGAKLSKP